MNTLVLIGLALVVAGFVLLAVRFVPRVRRQFAATAAQPRTVADLVRLRQQAGSMAQAAPRVATPRVAAPPAARPEPAQPRPTPVTATVAAAAPAAPEAAPPAPEPPAPVFVPPSPRPTPVAGRVQRESAEPPSHALDGDNAPWQRGARMAVGLGGGQPWREPPAPPAPLRIVPAADASAPEEATTPAVETPAEPEVPAPVAPAEPESRADAREEQETPAEVVAAEPATPARPAWIEPGVAPEASADTVEDDATAAREPVAAEPAPQPQGVWVEPEALAGRPRPAVPAAEAPLPTERDETEAEDVPVTAAPEPVAAEPAPQPQGVWVEPEALAGRPRPAVPAAEAPLPTERDETEAEHVPAAVPSRFAEEEPPAAPDPEPERRRGRQTPDEKAAEQAAADLALLRTFGFADAGLHQDSAPVVAMEHPEEQDAPVEAGAAQPVRYRVVRRDGTVVGGATVTLLDDRGGDVAAGAADAEGRGEVSAPAPGGYVLVSTAAGHQPGAVAITVTGSATETDVLIARSASVSGSVHGQDGPIAGARVTLVQDGEAVDAVDTDAQGAYRIGDIGAGEYGLSVAAPGREPVAALLEVAEEAEVRHDVELKPASPVADGDLVEDDAMSGLR
ncbi:carboxypeptidase regulatory-like domain-containing protein [Pseudonocardia adelaidensis]|uniref:Carboxypeptidase family protein n=1 Tax=Pseudonocardia adelaidensis TaxID=648754 RepID=A0ABP9NQX7_9PSEU